MKLKVLAKQPNARACFVCGVKNQSGLSGQFYELEGGYLWARFYPADFHQSYPGILHGGVSSALLDELIGRAIQIENKEQWGVTTGLTLTYHAPLSLTGPLTAIARINQQNRLFFSGVGIILNEAGEIAVIGHGRYFKKGIEAITDHQFLSNDWVIYPQSSDPVEIEVSAEIIAKLALEAEKSGAK